MWGLVRGNSGAVGKDQITYDPDDNGESSKDVKLESDTIYTHYGYKDGQGKWIEESKPVGL